MAEPLAGCYIPCIGTPCSFLVFGRLHYLSSFFLCKYSEGGPHCLIIFCWHPYNLAFLQGSAAVSSFPEVALSSETNSFKGNFADVDTEKLFVAGILDELKICFSCGYEVFLS